MAEIAAAEDERCPLFDKCNRGELLGPGMLNCIPRQAMNVARLAQRGHVSVEVEMRDYAKAPVFPPHNQGFIDPYADPDDPEHLTTGKPEILEKVQAWAETILYGQPLVPLNLTGHCANHELLQKDCADCRMARLVLDDQTTTVYPNGVATRVPRDKCRCPIMRVGDFCPVHGG